LTLLSPWYTLILLAETFVKLPASVVACNMVIFLKLFRTSVAKKVSGKKKTPKEEEDSTFLDSRNGDDEKNIASFNV